MLKLLVLARRHIARAEGIAMIQVRLNSGFRQLERLSFVADRHFILPGAGSGL